MSDELSAVDTRTAATAAEVSRVADAVSDDFAQAAFNPSAAAEAAALERPGIEQTQADIQGLADTEQNIDEANKLAEEKQKEEAESKSGLFWDQPHPKGHPASANPYPSARYPYNHVFESEIGHIVEFDDDVRTARTLTQHTNDSFEEIISTNYGKNEKVVKVEGDSYEIVAGKKNIFINSSGKAKDGVTLTVQGNMRHLVMGDYILEVTGDFTQKIHGSKSVKTMKDVAEEIGGGESRKIGGFRTNVIGEGDVLITGGHMSRRTARNYNLQADHSTIISSRRKGVFESAQGLELIGDDSVSLLSSKNAVTVGANTTVFVDGKEVRAGTLSPAVGGLTSFVQVGVPTSDQTAIYSGGTTYLNAIGTIYVDGTMIHLNYTTTPAEDTKYGTDASSIAAEIDMVL